MSRKIQCTYSKIDMDLNYKTWNWLDKITIGLFDKFGVKYPLSYQDCKIIARIISNHIKYQEQLEELYIYEYFGIESLEKDEIEFLYKLANFFMKAEKGVIEIR